MSLTPSSMLPLGTPCPDFDLIDTRTGERVCRSDFDHRDVLVVMFICNHCPYVIHVQDELVRLGHEFRDSPVQLVAICANDAASYPEDGPERMREQAERLGYAFSYLHDAEQSVARAFHAACTPDFFVFDQQRHCVYRGQLDGARPGNDLPVDGRDLRAAIRACRDGEPPLDEQTPSVGCNIKWSFA